MSVMQVASLTLAKELRLEWRSKDAFNAMLFFALLVAVIFAFSFDPTMEESRRIVGGLVWIAFLFASNVALSQSWARELRHHVLDAFRLSPADPNALFLGKTIGNFLFVLLLEAILAPLFVVFYNLRMYGESWQLIVIFVAGTWALVSNGTFFAALSARTRNRELMLPLLLFPISIPAILGMVESTAMVLAGEGSPRFWISLLLVYDVVFTGASLLLFDMVMNAE